MDVTQLPGNQNTNEQKHGKSDTKCQRLGHVAGFLFAICAVFQHEEERCRQTANDGKKSDGYKVIHGFNYPAMKRCAPSSRFLVVTVAALVVSWGTFSLGQWQLRRAAEKENLQASIMAQSQRKALNASDVAQLDHFELENHRLVSLEGVWQSSKTLFLDNRPMGEKTGFWVYTPLALDGSHRMVLVQRGWVPRDFLDRSKLPVIETPTGRVTVQGRIAPPPSKLYAFNGEDMGQIRQNIDLAALRKETGLSLLEVSVVQTGSPSEGLRRDWPAPDMGVDRHYGYAFQWFALCALAVGLFGWFQVWLPYRSAPKRNQA